MAVPRESASEFPALEGSEIETEEIEVGADELDQAATDLARANEKAAQKKEAAWLVEERARTCRSARPRSRA